MDKITFTKRHIPIYPEYRPLYKISLLLLILKKCCRANKSSLLKLHLIYWGINKDDNLKEITNLISKKSFDLQFWSIQPSLNRALDFAIASNLCLRIGDRYELGEKGDKFVSLIIKDNELLSKNKYRISKIEKRVTETIINNLTKEWKL